MEKNGLQLEFERLSKNSKIINLIDTNFHKNGFIFPQELLKSFINNYLSKRMYNPDAKGNIEARESISNYYKSNSVNVDPENIIITASSSESYNLIFNNFTEVGDNIILPQPFYPLFEFLASFNYLECKFYKMPFENNFQIDIDSIYSAIDKRSKIIVLISPNNPTGQIISMKKIQQIIDICQDKDLMLICDEVFSEFIYSKDANFLRPASLNSNVTIFSLNGISKMFSCPDLKLSWIAATGEKKQLSNILNTLELSNDMFLNCNSLSQYMLRGFFSCGKDFQIDMIKRINENRNILINQLSSNPNISFVKPIGGIHTIIKINGLDKVYDDEEFAIELLKQKKVYVHPGYFYGLEGGIYIIISYLKKKNLLLEGLKRLNEFVITT